MQMNRVNSAQQCILLYCFICILTREMSVHSTKQITSREDEFEANKIGNIFFTTTPGSRASTPGLCFAFLTHGFHIMFFDTDVHQQRQECFYFSWIKYLSVLQHFIIIHSFNDNIPILYSRGTYHRTRKPVPGLLNTGILECSI